MSICNAEVSVSPTFPNSNRKIYQWTEILENHAEEKVHSWGTRPFQDITGH